MVSENTIVIRSAVGILVVERATGKIVKLVGSPILYALAKFDTQEFAAWEARELGDLAGKRNLIEIEEIGGWFVDGDYLSPSGEYRAALLESRAAILHIMKSAPPGALFGVHLARCDSPEHNHGGPPPPTTKH